jgi:hypothetical protein
VDAFQSACNYISQVAFKKRRFGPIALHALVYQKVRAAFKLPVSPRLQARFSGAGLHCIHRHDQRPGQVWLVLGEYQRKILQKPVKSASLVPRKAGLFLKICVAYDVPPKFSGAVGVDLSYSKIALK